MNNPVSGKRERKVPAKFLSRLANDKDTPPVICEAVSNITFWFAQYLDTDASLIIEKCLEGYCREGRNRNVRLIGH